MRKGIGIPPIIIIGCVAVFIMFISFLFILERFLKLNDILEKTCKAEDDKFAIEKGRCQLNMMVSLLITYISTFAIACFIGITGYMMIRNFKGIEGA